MVHENKKEQGRIMGNGFEPTPNNSMGDWGGSDGFSMWDSTAGNTEGLIQDWEGRQETHDMLNESYD